jgi:hypothetical protein
MSPANGIFSEATRKTALVGDILIPACASDAAEPASSPGQDQVCMRGWCFVLMAQALNLSGRERRRKS